MNNIGKCALIAVMVLFGSLQAMEERATVPVVVEDTKQYVQSILSKLEIDPNILKVENNFGYCMVENATFKSFFTGTSGIVDVGNYIAQIQTRIHNYVNDDLKLDFKKQVHAVKSDNDLKNDRKNIAGHYKIHLMPGSKDLCTKIIRAILTNEDIKANIEKFKLISPAISFNGFWKNPKRYLTTCDNNSVKLGIPPIMVLYCARGKPKAQKILDILYASFGDQSGVGIAPRFSEQVTGLIFYTQDNSNEKVERKDIELNAQGKSICSIANIKKLSPDAYSILFPNPIFNEDKTLYHENFVSKKEKKDYHLSIPSLKEKDTKKEEPKKKKSKKKKVSESK